MGGRILRGHFTCYCALRTCLPAVLTCTLQLSWKELPSSMGRRASVRTEGAAILAFPPFHPNPPRSAQCSSKFRPPLHYPPRRHPPAASATDIASPGINNLLVPSTRAQGNLRPSGELRKSRREPTVDSPRLRKSLPLVDIRAQHALESWNREAQQPQSTGEASQATRSPSCGKPCRPSRANDHLYPRMHD